MVLEGWWHWLEGAEQPFVVWTDHENLSYIQSVRLHNFQQARWALFFGRFNLSLIYRVGSCNVKPDTLSQQFSEAECDVKDEPKPSSPWTGFWLPEKLRPQDATLCRQSMAVVPTSSLSQQHSRVLQWVHSSRLACHPGYTHTLTFLQRRFWWATMDRDIREFVNVCTM